MKKLIYFYLALFLFGFPSKFTFSQVSGDYRSTGSGGDWNNSATWETYDGSSWNAAGAEPSTSNNVSILAGHTVNIVSNSNSKNLTVSGTLIFGKATIALSQYTLNLTGNLTVNNDGEISVFDTGVKTEHEVFISGNLSNAGIITTLSTSNINALYFNFNGTEDVQVSGNSITFSGLTINLTAEKTADFTSIISLSDPDNNGFRLFDLVRGIFKLSSASTITPFSGASNIQADAGFFLNHTDAVSNWGSSGSLVLNGLLRIDNGIMNIGSTSGNKLDVNGSGAEYIMNGGILNISGYWDQTSNGKAAINNGTINVLSSSSVSNSVEIVNIPNTCEFVMNNGSFNVKNLNTGSGATLYINKNINSSISGGTFSISNSDNVATEAIFHIDEELSFYDLTVDIGSTASLEDISSNVVVSNNLTIQSGTIKINPALGLTVNGTLTNSVGASGLVIESDDNGTGSLIVGSVSGNVTVKRYLTNYDNSTDAKYHFISSPVSSQAIQPEFVTDPPTAGVDFYKFDETTNTWINSKALDGENVIWNTGFGDNFEVGRGYLVAYPTEIPKAFSGTLNNNASYVLNCTYTEGQGNGWNLLGNPYPAAIDWDAVTLGDGVDNALYYYDASTQNYIAYLRISGDNSTSTGGSRYIPAGQGFMVHANNTGSTKTVTIEKADLTHTGQDVYYKSSTNLLAGSLSLQVTGNNFNDKTIIHFNEQATTDFDGNYDAFKLMSANMQVPMIYTENEENTQFAINGLPQVEEGTSIPVSLRIGADGTYTIEANINEIETNIFLEDLFTGTSTKLNETSSYSFTASEGDNPNRFLLHFGVVGLDENDTESSLRAYTYNNRLYVQNSLEAASIRILDLQGRLLLEQQLNGQGLQSLPLDFPAGVYVVQLVNSKAQKSVKVIVE